MLILFHRGNPRGWHEIRRNCSQPVNTRETFLNKDRMVETRRILEARQCSEKSDGLAVGTTPVGRKQTFGCGGRGEEREREVRAIPGDSRTLK